LEYRDTDVKATLRWILWSQSVIGMTAVKGLFMIRNYAYL